MLNLPRRILPLSLGLLLLTLATAVVAQVYPPPLLTLSSPDPDYPVRFQVVPAGESPSATRFSRLLGIGGPPINPDRSLVYIAIPNTGWSEGVLGLISDLLPHDWLYVALEIDADGQPVEGGLVFDMIYDEELGNEGGFRLHVLIDRTRRFGIFPGGIGEDGRPFAARTTVREADGSISQVPVGVSLEAEPVAIFDPLALEFHIVAQPGTALTPTATQPALSFEGWGDCSSCESCGHPNECVLAPDGQCLWNPGACAAGAPLGAQATLPPGGAGPTAVPLTVTVGP
jgi:hypothetical protein